MILQDQYNGQNIQRKLVKYLLLYIAMEPIYAKRSHLVAFGRESVRTNDKDRGDKNLLIDPPTYIEDEYFWLRNDKRDNEEIISLLKKENEFFEQNIDNVLSEQLKTDII